MHTEQNEIIVTQTKQSQEKFIRQVIKKEKRRKARNFVLGYLALAVLVVADQEIKKSEYGEVYQAKKKVISDKIQSYVK